MPKVSIIMPTYNVEKYLEAALESVVNQTFSDIEIICINDGSTDNSLQILENYAKQDNRIKLINQQNQGVSVARNNGIEAAAGEYIMFLDPDDTYDLKLCEKVVQKIDKENPDIVMWGHNSLFDGKIVKTDEYVYLLNRLERNLKINLKNWLALQIFIWDKAFKKDFLIKNNIRFPEGIKNAEDIIFCLLSYYAKPRYSFIPESLYFYTQYREDAATNKDNCIQNDLTAYKYLCTTDEYKNISQKLKTATTNHILGGAIHYWRYAASEPLKQRYQKDIEEFLEYVKGQFGVLELTKMSNYRKLKHLLFKYRHKKFFDKFDIRTTDTEKTYVLFGKKFRVKRWTKVLREKLLKEGIVEKVDFEKRIINIVMILDEQYFYCTAVALSSMKRNKNKKNIYKIYLCHNNLNKKQLEYLESFKSSYFDIIFIDTAKYIEKYKNLSQYCHVTTTALIKFDLQDILKGLDKVLYLDVDIIANKDMSDIYNTDITDYYLAATREIIPEKRGWNKEVGTKYYFNSGVMLLNLTKMRTANLSKKMIEKKQNQPSGWKCQDQHIFNWAVNDNFKSLPITCNALVFLYQKKHITIKEINYFYNTDFKNFSDLLKKTYIIHFGGDGKPWIYYIPRYSRFYKKYSKYIKYSTQPKLKRYFDINRPLENIFSIRNSYSKSHKVITLIGIKLKIKRNIRSN